MKRYGACTDCDTEVFDCRARWPEGTPLEGHIRIRMGAKDNAMRATIALMDGSSIDLTFCADCIPTIAENMVKIWDKVIQRHVLSVDPEVRKALGYPEHNPRQHEAAEREAIHLIHNKPFGVLAVQPWNEVVEWLA